MLVRTIGDFKAYLWAKSRHSPFYEWLYRLVESSSWTCHVDLHNTKKNNVFCKIGTNHLSVLWSFRLYIFNLHNLVNVNIYLLFCWFNSCCRSPSSPLYQLLVQHLVTFLGSLFCWYQLIIGWRATQSNVENTYFTRHFYFLALDDGINYYLA